MSSRRHGSKRHSGIFEQPVTGLQRRTSKRASSSDRQGHVYPDNFPDTSTITAASPDAGLGDTTPVNSSRRSSVHAPSSPTTVRSAWGRPGSSSSHREAIHGSESADYIARRRTRTIEERVHDASPDALASKSRNPFSSVHALPTPIPHDTPEAAEPADPFSSIGFPSIEATSRSAAAGPSRQRLVKPPPLRPLSPPPVVPPPNVNIPALPSPLPDTAKILQLMKITCGRMHGILFFRTTTTGPWSSGYCAINVATGSLIYQMKGDVSHARTLVADLRGCTVRTQNDADARASFLEIATRLGPTALGHSTPPALHLRPHVPETFDSWLAALLCWQPLRPRSARNGKGAGKPALPGPAERRAGDRRRSSVLTTVHDAVIIKVGKMLYWDHDAPRATAAIPPPPERRVSTYRQQRLAAAPPWRKVSCTLQENGLLKIYADSSPNLLQVVPLPLLAQGAVQRLHPTVLDDEFCVAVYPQYRAGERAVDFRRPLLLSMEGRVPFEVWYVLLRAFAVPELYGPERLRAGLRESVDLSAAADGATEMRTEGLFRVERILRLRLIEAKVFTPQDVGQEIGSNGGRKRATSGPGRDAVLGDYHAEVVLDGEVRGRTAVKTDTGNPFWREDYEFSALPLGLRMIGIRLKARSPSQKDWALIADERTDYESGDVASLGIAGDVQVSPLNSIVGLIPIRLDDIERGKEKEEWWPVKNERGQLVGEIFMKIRVDETVILMSHDYQPLSELLNAFSNGLTQEAILTCPGALEARRLHEIFLNIFQVSGTAETWLTALVEDEIDGVHREPLNTKYRYNRRIASNDSYDSGVEREVVLRDLGRSAAQEAHLLFRGNSLLTKALDLHMRRLGREYLEDTIGANVRDIDESNPDCEVDPNRVANAEDVERNWRNLIALTENLWRAIVASADRCPPELRRIFRHIWSCADDRFGKFLRTVTYSSVSGFLFLRFFCPAVLNPKLFGLLKGKSKRLFYFHRPTDPANRPSSTSWPADIDLDCQIASDARQYERFR